MEWHHAYCEASKCSQGREHAWPKPMGKRWRVQTPQSATGKNSGQRGFIALHPLDVCWRLFAGQRWSIKWCHPTGSALNAATRRFGNWRSNSLQKDRLKWTFFALPHIKVNYQKTNQYYVYCSANVSKIAPELTGVLTESRVYPFV